MGIQQALVTVTGNLGATPTPFTTSANVPACSFRMGVTPRFFDQNTGQWRDRGTSWVSVCAYRGLAKNILGSLEKGDPVIVTGMMRTERWQKEGVDRVTPVIDASAVGPDLSQGIARISRIPRNQPGTAGGGADGAGAAGGGTAGGVAGAGATGGAGDVRGAAIGDEPAGGGAAGGADSAGVGGAAGDTTVNPATGEMREPASDGPEDFASGQI